MGAAGGLCRLVPGVIDVRKTIGLGARCGLVLAEPLLPLPQRRPAVLLVGVPREAERLAGEIL